MVLVHGLSDSPYFMTAIGEYFFKKLGYNVYMSLLHLHGLKDPKGMAEVELEEWKSNVAFAIQTAAEKSNRVSIGGLSTGDTLSFYMAVTQPKINDSLYLFSVAGGPLGLVGDLKEKLLLKFNLDIIEKIQKIRGKTRPLIGPNPFRYDYVDLDGARELARLIKETDIISNGFSPDFPFEKRVFAAHSELDKTADIAGIKRLNSISEQSKFTFWPIAETHNVAHASLVLKDPIKNGGKILDQRNTKFNEMLDAIYNFEHRLS